MRDVTGWGPAADFWVIDVGTLFVCLTLALVVGLLAWCALDWLLALGRVVGRELERENPRP